jgi:uncharacterized protein YjbJ (UPF0337 family)
LQRRAISKPERLDTDSVQAAVSKNHFQERTMNKDQVKGRVEEAKGKIKEVAGKVVGNPNLEQKGKVEQAVGKVQAGYGDLKNAVRKGV